MKKDKKTSERTSEFCLIYKGTWINVEQDPEDYLYYASIQRPGMDYEAVPGMSGMSTPTAAKDVARRHIDALGL